MPEPVTRQPEGARSPRLATRLAAVAAAVLLLAMQPIAPVRAANVLSGGSVDPTSGPIGQRFTFTVTYSSSSPPRDAEEVWADVAGLRVDLSLASGNATNGTWSGSRSNLPAGTWPVVFRATVDNGTGPTPLAGISVTVTAPPTPPPSPPGPTPTASPRTPTPAPTRTPAPPPTPTLPPGATPRPTPRPTPRSTPRPTATPTLPLGQPPGPAPAATPAASAAPSADQSAGESPVASAAASSDASATASASSGAARPSGSASPGVAADGDGDGFDSGPWVLLGGGVATVGAVVIAVQWLHLRRRSPLP